MSRLYDPISQTVLEKEDFPEPSSLQGLCRKGIIQAVTLGDIEKVIYIVQLGQLLKIWWKRECPLPHKPKNPNKNSFICNCNIPLKIHPVYHYKGTSTPSPNVHKNQGRSIKYEGLCY